VAFVGWVMMNFWLALRHAIYAFSSGAEEMPGRTGVK